MRKSFQALWSYIAQLNPIPVVPAPAFDNDSDPLIDVAMDF